MAKTAFTPGPWNCYFYGPTDTWIRTATGDAIVEIGHNQLNQQANAHLISAAPELFQALQEMDNLIENLFEAVPWGKTFGLDIKALNEAPLHAKAAIKKALGK